jgi:hypothetical protein|tara:strand:+ start:947 stop:1297 length:351 start_codon:yes stop_codon:yes gene_type:complete
MATLTVATAVESGVATADTSANSGGDEFVNTGREVLVVVNSHGSDNDINVTITAQTTSFTDPLLGTLTKANQVVAVNEGVTKVIGPFPTAAFNDGAGKVQITYSAVTSLKVGVVQI